MVQSAGMHCNPFGRPLLLSCRLSSRCENPFFGAFLHCHGIRSKAEHQTGTICFIAIINHPPWQFWYINILEEHQWCKMDYVIGYVYWGKVLTKQQTNVSAMSTSHPDLMFSYTAWAAKKGPADRYSSFDYLWDVVGGEVVHQTSQTAAATSPLN